MRSNRHRPVYVLYGDAHRHGIGQGTEAPVVLYPEGKHVIVLVNPVSKMEQSGGSTEGAGHSAFPFRPSKTYPATRCVAPDHFQRHQAMQLRPRSRALEPQHHPAGRAPPGGGSWPSPPRGLNC